MEAFPKRGVQTQSLLLLKASLITSKSSECRDKLVERAKFTLLLGQQSLLPLLRNLAGMTEPAAVWKCSGFQTPGTAQPGCFTSLTCFFPWQGSPCHLSAPVSFLLSLGTATSPYHLIVRHRQGVPGVFTVLPCQPEVWRNPNPSIWERQKGRMCC